MKAWGHRQGSLEILGYRVTHSGYLLTKDKNIDPILSLNNHEYLNTQNETNTTQATNWSCDIITHLN